MATVSDRRQTPAPWLWLAAGALAAVGVSFVAAAVNRGGWAPVGLTSLGVGVVLGLVLSALAAVVGPCNRRMLIVGTVAMALVTVAATHAWLYRGFCSDWQAERDKSAQVAMFRPETPWSPREYFAHELTPGRAALWAVDAALVVLGSVGTVVVWHRHATIRRAEQAPPLNPPVS